MRLREEGAEERYDNALERFGLKEGGGAGSTRDSSGRFTSTTEDGRQVRGGFPSSTEGKEESEQEVEEPSSEAKPPAEEPTQEPPSDAPALEPATAEQVAEAPEAPTPPPPRLYAGRFQSPEDLEKAYQDALSLAGRHGQELGHYRTEAEQRAAEAAQYRQQLQAIAQQQEQQRQQALFFTPYEQLSDEQAEQLSKYAESQGVDPQYAQFVGRMMLQQRAQWQQEQAQVQERQRTSYVAGNLEHWLRSRPDFAEMGAEVAQMAQQRQHLFNVPATATPEQEMAHYQQAFELLFDQVAYRRARAEQERQAGLKAQAQSGNAAALDARKSASGESAASPTPRAPVHSGRKSQSSNPVEEILKERASKRSLMRIVQGG